MPIPGLAKRYFFEGPIFFKLLVSASAFQQIPLKHQDGPLTTFASRLTFLKLVYVKLLPHRKAFRKKLLSYFILKLNCCNMASRRHQPRHENRSSSNSDNLRTFDCIPIKNRSFAASRSKLASASGE